MNIIQNLFERCLEHNSKNPHRLIDFGYDSFNNEIQIDVWNIPYVGGVIDCEHIDDLYVELTDTDLESKINQFFEKHG